MSNPQPHSTQDALSHSDLSARVLEGLRNAGKSVTRGELRAYLGDAAGESSIAILRSLQHLREEGRIEVASHEWDGRTQTHIITYRIKPDSGGL